MIRSGQARATRTNRSRSKGFWPVVLFLARLPASLFIADFVVDSLSSKELVPLPAWVAGKFHCSHLRCNRPAVRGVSSVVQEIERSGRVEYYGNGLVNGLYCEIHTFKASEVYPEAILFCGSYLSSCRSWGRSG